MCTSQHSPRAARHGLGLRLIDVHFSPLQGGSRSGLWRWPAVLGALYPSTWHSPSIQLSIGKRREGEESYLLTYTFILRQQHRSLLTSCPHSIHHSLYYTFGLSLLTTRPDYNPSPFLRYRLLGTPLKKAYLCADRHLHRLVSWSKHLSLQNRPQPRINIFSPPQPHPQWRSDPTPRSQSPTSSPMIPTSTAENAAV